MSALDTPGYATGPHQLTLTVTSSSGSAQTTVPFEVEPLAAPMHVSSDPQPFVFHDGFETGDRTTWSQATP